MSEAPVTSRTPSPVPAPRAAREPGPPQVLLLLAGSCMAVLGAVLIAPVLPQMTTHFAATPGVEVLVPVVLTVPALMIGLTSLFAGVLADRTDRKRVLVVAMVAYSAFGTAPLYLDSLQAIIASRVLVGLCEAAIITCCTTLIADYWSGRQRARLLGVQTLCSALSATVFLAVGGALGSAGWRTPFWLYLVAAVLAVPMAKHLWNPARAGGTAAQRPARSSVPWRALLGPCLVTIFGGVVFYALIVQLAFVLTGLGVTSTAAIGGISAAMSAATAAGSVAFTRLTHLTPAKVLPACFAVSAVGLLVVSTGSSAPVVTVGALLTGFGTGLMLPTLLTWAVGKLAFEERGRGTGLWTGTLFVGQFASPLVLAAVAVGAGGLQPALGALGVASAAAAVVTLLALRGRTQRLDTTTEG